MRSNLTLSLVALLHVTCAWSLTRGAAEAQASDDDRARSHFQAATSYFEQRRFSEAAEQFLESYRLSNRRELLLNAATAYERAEEHARAADVLERYLGEHPDAPDRATIQTRLEQDRARAPAAEPSEPAALGDLGMAGVVLTGVGVLSGIGAIVTGVVAVSVHDSLAERCGPDGAACPPGYQSDVDLGQGLAVATDVLLPVSIAALGAGLTLLALDLTDGDADEASAALAPGPGDVGVALRLRW